MNSGNHQLFINFSDIKHAFVKQTWFDSMLIIDVLRIIVNDVSAQREQRNMTQRFYAHRALAYIIRFVHTRPLIVQWIESMDRDLLKG